MSHATAPIATDMHPSVTPRATSGHAPKVEVPVAEFRDADVLLPGEAESLLAGAPWHRFAVLGDSVAKGIGDPVLGYRSTSWADRVAEALPGEYLNLGSRGLSATQVRDRQVQEAIAWEPDLAAVVAGGNDAFAGWFDPAATAMAIDETYTRLQRAGADVIGFTLLPPSVHLPNRARTARRFALINERIRNIALVRGVTLVDLATRRFSNGSGIFSADQLHPNMRAYAAIASATIESLAELIRNKDGEL